jgi:undecaprenyl diphosphate synthase
LRQEQGYQYGLDPGLSLLRQAKESGIDEVTFYGFTTDNCKRPAVQYQAFAAACVEAARRLASEGADLLVLGNYDSPSFPHDLLPYRERREVAGGGIKLNFLVNYGWEWDLAGMQPADSRRKICQGLRSHDVSRIDLVVRWGGMRRLSGLLPVQAVYADFYVVDALWPDWQPEHLYEALRWYDRQDVTLGG